MARQPLVKGRKLPLNDWEGDDFTPGAHGAFVTCQDTAAGRMVAYATNGRVDKDGRVYRAAIPYDPDGITLQQADVAVHKVAKLDIVIPSDWRWSQVLTHLRNYKGLIVDGWYAEIPRAYRYQLGAAFAHAIFVSHYSPTSGMRVWDPLNPDTHAYGRWIPAPVVRAFAEELSRRNRTASLYVGYVPLQAL
jgi:hypothetical protein